MAGAPPPWLVSAWGSEWSAGAGRPTGPWSGFPPGFASPTATSTSASSSGASASGKASAGSSSSGSGSASSTPGKSCVHVNIPTHELTHMQLRPPQLLPPRARLHPHLKYVAWLDNAEMHGTDPHPRLRLAQPACRATHPRSPPRRIQTITSRLSFCRPQSSGRSSRGSSSRRCF